MEPGLREPHRDDRHEQRRAEHQRPADRPRAAQLAGERAALGVAERRTSDDREQQLEVGGAQRAARRETNANTSTASSAGRRSPARTRGVGRSPARSTAITAVAAGSSADDDRAVRGGPVVQRQRGEQREADDDAGGDDRQRAPLRAGRPRLRESP